MRNPYVICRGSGDGTEYWCGGNTWERSYAFALGFPTVLAARECGEYNLFGRFKVVRIS